MLTKLHTSWSYQSLHEKADAAIKIFIDLRFWSIVSGVWQLTNRGLRQGVDN